MKSLHVGLYHFTYKDTQEMVAKLLDHGFNPLEHGDLILASYIAENPSEWVELSIDFEASQIVVGMNDYISGDVEMFGRVIMQQVAESPNGRDVVHNLVNKYRGAA